MLSAKFRFASPPWFEEVQAKATKLSVEMADALRGHRYRLCEIYTDVPEDVGAPSGIITWNLLIEDGTVSVRFGEPDEVDFKMRCAYDAIVPLARMKFSADPVAMRQVEALRTALAQRSGSEIKGSIDTAPAAVKDFLYQLHNHFADLTL